MNSNDEVYEAEVYESTDNESEYSTSNTGEAQQVLRRRRKSVYNRRLARTGLNLFFIAFHLHYLEPHQHIYMGSQCQRNVS